MCSVSVYSIFMSNIPTEVVELQEKCVRRCLPAGWKFTQYGTTDTHAQALGRISRSCSSDLLIFLDIDCIPLSFGAFKSLELNAMSGSLTGCVQRANHKNNNAHLYIGPFCMAFNRMKYEFLGSPTFEETPRGDIGEELTYAWQERGEPLCFFWPSEVLQPVWDLRENEKFGFGTTYDGMFYHSFCIRDPRLHQHFIEKCHQVLGDKELHVLPVSSY